MSKNTFNDLGPAWSEHAEWIFEGMHRKVQLPSLRLHHKGGSDG